MLIEFNFIKSNARHNIEYFIRYQQICSGGVLMLHSGELASSVEYLHHQILEETTVGNCLRREAQGRYKYQGSLRHPVINHQSYYNFVMINILNFRSNHVFCEMGNFWFFFTHTLQIL